ncbi:MAG: acylphosphatase [Bacteroidia bacterium]
MRHYNITVKGKVQRVSYRFSAQQMAIKLGLTGYVKNLPNGDVFIEAEGEEEAINKLIEWCYVGPPLAKVIEVGAVESELRHFKTFELKRL